MSYCQGCADRERERDEARADAKHHADAAFSMSADLEVLRQDVDEARAMARRLATHLRAATSLTFHDVRVAAGRVLADFDALPWAKDTSS